MPRLTTRGRATTWHARPESGLRPPIAVPADLLNHAAGRISSGRIGPAESQFMQSSVKSRSAVYPHRGTTPHVYPDACTSSRASGSLAAPGVESGPLQLKVARVPSGKLALVVTFSTVATLCPSVIPSFAQELARQPPTVVAPQPSIKSPATPRLPSTTIDPETNYRYVTVACRNGDRYKLTTGSTEGACKILVESGSVKGAFCTDGTNSALQSCSTGCKEITGSGACARQDGSAR